MIGVWLLLLIDNIVVLDSYFANLNALAIHNALRVAAASDTYPASVIKPAVHSTSSEQQQIATPKTESK